MKPYIILLVTILLTTGCRKKTNDSSMRIPPNTYQLINFNGEPKVFNHIVSNIFADSFLFFTFSLTKGSDFVHSLSFNRIRLSLGKQSLFNQYKHICREDFSYGRCKPIVNFLTILSYDEPGEEYVPIESTNLDENWIEIEEIKEGEYIKCKFQTTLFRHILYYGKSRHPDTIQISCGTIIIPYDTK